MFEWKVFSLTKKCCRPALSCFQFRMNYLRHESKTTTKDDKLIYSGFLLL